MEARTSVQACSSKRHNSSSELQEAGTCGTDIFSLTTIVTLEPGEVQGPCKSNQLNLTYYMLHIMISFAKVPSE